VERGDGKGGGVRREVMGEDAASKAEHGGRRRRGAPAALPSGIEFCGETPSWASNSKMGSRMRMCRLFRCLPLPRSES
jgi:hypothetical protein